jgi:isochorismate hydrolase
MKEEYLNSLTLQKTTDELLAELTGEHYRSKPWKLNPGKAALLVLDMQNYFLDPASHAFTPSAPAILSNINKLISFAMKCKMDIIFTRHVNNNSNAGMMNKWWKDIITEDSYEAQISETVRLYEGKTVGRESPIRDDSMVEKKNETTESPARDDSMVENDSTKIIVKNQYDAFYNTDLEEYIRSKNIEQLIITGVLTNLCCETTARSAFVKGFEVLFPIDATAAYNREFHLSTFRNLGFGFCPILKTSDLINSFNEPE